MVEVKKKLFFLSIVTLISVLFIFAKRYAIATNQQSFYLPFVFGLYPGSPSPIPSPPISEPHIPPSTLIPSPTSESTNTPTTIPTYSSTMEIRVSGSENDAEESEIGSMQLTSKDLELVFSGSNQTVGMKFDNVNIPKNAIITKVFIQFQVDEISSENTTLVLRADLSEIAQSFSSNYKNITSRAVTTSGVEWEPEPWGVVGEVGLKQQTPDLSPVIQEVIRQSGWESGNSIVIILTGSGKRVAESFDGEPSGAPFLHIEFSIDQAQIPSQTTTSEPTTDVGPTTTHTVTNTSSATSTILTPTESATTTSSATPSDTPTVIRTQTPSPLPSETPTFTSTPSNTPVSSVSPTPSPIFPVFNPIELSFIGPDSIGMGTPNPFLIEMETVFYGPGSRSFVISGYYDGDGNGGMDGSKWKVKFTPDMPGEWEFTTNSSEPLLDGHIGTFYIDENDDCPTYQTEGMLNYSCVGRLEFVGEHYLKFQNGPYWLKGGGDDPEDFLAPGTNVGFSNKYQAIDFLASKGVNSLYLLLNNIGGDGNNVWPWVGTTSSEAQSNQERFDLVKLAEWESLFSYLQQKGIVLHLLFEDDGGWSGFNRMLYYRQIISRFGHHNVLIWNISEEYDENYSADQIKAFGQMIRSLDPYDHPITVHHSGPLDQWLPFVGDNRFDMTSFQTEKSPVNLEAGFWFELVENSGRTIPISFDETGKIGVADQDISRHILWSVYMGGGNFEMHTFPLNSFVDFSAHFSDMTRARHFFEDIPFWAMQPKNNLLISGVGYVFAQDGEVYTAYLPYGGQIELDLTGISQNFDCEWFNPRDGSRQPIGTIQGGTVQDFITPTLEDWVLLLISG